MTIGVAAVIILVAVGNGSKRRSRRGIDALGSNVLLVQAAGRALRRPGRLRRRRRRDARPTAGRRRAAGRVQRARRQERARRWSTRPARRSSPARRATSRARSSARRPPTRRRATTRSPTGAMFTDADVKQHQRVVVLGPTVVANLFAGAGPGRPDDPRQRHELPGRRRDQAQGLQRRPGPGRRRDRAAHRGPGHAHRLRRGSATITVQARSAATLDAAQAEVTSILDRAQARHRLRPTRASRSSTRARCARPRRRAPSVFTTLLGAVAAISLLVGGIGVMNIMLVSRHRAHARDRHPQGDRRAARRHPQRSSSPRRCWCRCSAASPGVVVGHRRQPVQDRRRQPGRSPLYSVFLAFGASVLAGLFFGTYPAAAPPRMRPIDALRFE